MTVIAGVRMTNGQRVTVKWDTLDAVKSCSFAASCDLFALGDVHGKSTLLSCALNLIRSLDCSGGTVVMLGDVLDRGPNPLGCVKILNELRPSDGLVIYNLMGNHERDFMAFAVGDLTRPLFEEWIEHYGGDTTLKDCSIDVAKCWEVYRHGRPPDLNESASLVLDYCARCLDCLRVGEIIFAHEPDKCREVLRSDPGLRVGVHGHVISNAIMMVDNLIGLDLGAYASNKLAMLRFNAGEISAAILEEKQPCDKFRQ